ncbi:unnamed protein product [Angiostrongylus costaricensis]|uniref:Essential MCU regulator, mitochondrial n=1 Tax=Angiostrongylus costaricensis TaxID=334426 RepID=A0A0R3Q2C1_ANGCS|nr:unnamed protein product [Angiostrongylus costaricensis]
MVNALAPGRGNGVFAISSLYFGGFVAHKGASFLEENEIFIPSDDDDDD